MLLPTGRLHVRTPLKLAIELLDPREPKADPGVTENVSRLGVRVLLRAPKEPNTVLLLNCPANNLRTSARVVYCEALSDGQFGVGLQLKEPAVDWRSQRDEQNSLAVQIRSPCPGDSHREETRREQKRRVA